MDILWRFRRIIAKEDKLTDRPAHRPHVYDHPLFWNANSWHHKVPRRGAELKNSGENN